MSYMTRETKDLLYKIIEEYTSDGSKITLDELSELSGLAKATISNNAKVLVKTFPNLARTINPSTFWIKDSSCEFEPGEKRDLLKDAIRFVEENSSCEKKVSSSDIIKALGITKKYFWSFSYRMLEANPNIKTSGGHGKSEKQYWIEKEIDMPKEKPAENIMETSPILDDDQICTPGEIWTEKGTVDAHGYDKRKWLVAAAVGHTVQALEVRMTEKGYNGMRDIWIDKAGICYLAPRLLRQMSDSQLDQYVATAPDDVMDKVRDKLRDIFGIKPVEVEKIVEVPVEVEKIVEKTVEVPVEVEKKENPGDISISKLEFELLKQRARIYESITKSLLARREVG